MPKHVGIDDEVEDPYIEWAENGRVRAEAERGATTSDPPRGSDTLLGPTVAEHIRVWREFFIVGGYWHHGIHVGQGRVIHFSGEPLNKLLAEVRQDPLDVFIGNAKKVETVLHREPDSPPTILQRAVTGLRQREYNLVFNNCEHFATWCAIGERRSDQVRAVAAAWFAPMFLPLPLGFLARIAAAFFAPRLSGRGSPLAPPPTIALGGVEMCPLCGSALTARWCETCGARR